MKVSRKRLLQIIHEEIQKELKDGDGRPHFTLEEEDPDKIIDPIYEEDCGCPERELKEDGEIDV